MKTTFFSLSVLTVSLFFSTTNSFAQKKEKDKVLVKKIYTVEFTETGVKKPKPVSDEINFNGEKMSSKFMSSENGFQASPYTVTVDSSASPKTIAFEVLGKNSDSEELKLNGTITGDAVEGTATVTRKGKTKHEYTFSGNLKEKPGKKK